MYVRVYSDLVDRNGDYNHSIHGICSTIVARRDAVYEFCEVRV